jgi:hypothetical protein
MKRPAWATRLNEWLIDGQYDGLPENAADWRYTWRDWRETVGRRALCFVFRHEFVPDQCGRREHDYCISCNSRRQGR